jgi:8-oxo-dGTP pyrophosphatase MutT (NUDIX family)
VPTVDKADSMHWKVISERALYTDQWLDLRTADVELPDGRHLDHRFIRMAPSAGAVLVDDQQRALLIWRHRFITRRWGWEIPMGMIDDGETPVRAAAREVEEETGWRPRQLQPLLIAQPTAGIIDAAHHVFVGTGAVEVGAPADQFESTAIQWVPLTDVPSLITKQDISSASTMAALLLLLTGNGHGEGTARGGRSNPQS